MLNIKYKDKLYKFAMNGQTGKMVGDIPIDKKKAFMWWLGSLLITALIVVIIGFIAGWL